MSIPHAMSFRRFNSQPPEGGWVCGYPNGEYRHRFNSQPPEGGWPNHLARLFALLEFQLTAARRRLDNLLGAGSAVQMFQLTAARRRLGFRDPTPAAQQGVSTHSRPKAAGGSDRCDQSALCRFNSQPPEGGWKVVIPLWAILNRFQLTAARRRLVKTCFRCVINVLFQLTAARRRLVKKIRW